MGSDLGQIFPTASLHRDHSISYALVCEKDFSDSELTLGSLDLVCVGILSHIPMHTRSSDPYVISLSEKYVPNRYPCEISVTNTRLATHGRLLM